MAEKKPRRFAWLQLDVSEQMAQEIKYVQEAIDPDHLGREGLCLEAHVTVLYGLHCFRPEEIWPHFNDCRPVPWAFGQISLFKNKGADVLKVSVNSPHLMALNETLRKRVPHYSTFPDYQPHVTIAHLKKAQSFRYEALPLPRLQHVSNHVTLHAKGRERFELRLDGKANAWERAEPKLF